MRSPFKRHLPKRERRVRASLALHFSAQFPVPQELSPEQELALLSMLEWLGGRSPSRAMFEDYDNLAPDAPIMVFMQNKRESLARLRTKARGRYTNTKTTTPGEAKAR